MLGFCFWLGVVVAPDARANLVIVPSFDSSITTDPDHVAIEAGINQAIAQVESYIANPISVSIQFVEDQSGLASSSANTNFLSYAKYLSDLSGRQTLSANDRLAIASLPNQTANPVNGNTKLTLNLPVLRALGETTLGSNAGGFGGFDGAVYLGTSQMNLSRTGPQDPNNYDLISASLHEIDEVLGIGGWGSVLDSAGPTHPTGPVGVLDLFRYSQKNVRSFTTSSTATAYFSIDKGATKLTGFEQDGNGDYSDWLGDPTPQVQDAYGNPGTIVDLGVNELTAFDVVGYDLVGAPEPGSTALLLTASAALLVGRRVRRSGGVWR